MREATEKKGLGVSYLLDVAPREPLQFLGDGGEVDAGIYSVLRHGHLQDLLSCLPAPDETRHAAKGEGGESTASETDGFEGEHSYVKFHAVPLLASFAR